MHTYTMKARDGSVWTVGYYILVGVEGVHESWSKWVPLKDFNSEDNAAQYAHYLNGGAK